MADQAPDRCPQCSGPLRITALYCPTCDLEITGEFARCRFCELPPEQLEFLTVFLRCRGVIKQMEKELGISYPTVRARVDDLLVALRLDEDEEPSSVQEVLEQLEAGDISAGEAVALIGELRRKRQ